MRPTSRRRLSDRRFSPAAREGRLHARLLALGLVVAAGACAGGTAWQRRHRVGPADIEPAALESRLAELTGPVARAIGAPGPVNDAARHAWLQPEPASEQLGLERYARQVRRVHALPFHAPTLGVPESILGLVRQDPEHGRFVREGALLHEAVHLVQLNELTRLGRPWFADEERGMTRDQVTARAAALEGQAELIAAQLQPGCEAPWGLLAQGVSCVLTGATGHGTGHPWSSCDPEAWREARSRYALIMLQGRRFAERVTRETGPHGLLAQLVENPPDSTWEIHAPEEYLARVRAERAAAPPTALAAR